MPNMPRWAKQLGSYILSFVVYSTLMNWKVALVFMGGIAFHECGHLYAARSLGMKTKGFYLFPFMGGAALIAERYKKYSDMAIVLLAGPFAGGILTAICYLVYLATGNLLIGTAALWMAWVNLFNLLPLAMLDGGQLIESVTYSINDLLGLVYLIGSNILGVAVLWFITHNPMLVGFIGFMGFKRVTSAWVEYQKKINGQEHIMFPQPDKMSASQITLTLISYSLTGAGLYGLVNLLAIHSLKLSYLFHS